MAGCGGCANRGNAIQRLMDRKAKGTVSTAKTAAYVAKSGIRDLTKALQASMNKTRRR